jgi:hypothetical protein
MLVLGVVLAAIRVANAKMRVDDAAREAARSASRGDDAAGRSLALQAAPGASAQCLAGRNG